ncbi:unnamed protein product [Lactuca saligna]|uniref:Uncharacterized protein n=1 Tax=Lactuca saligna TaxID=75948 RepID=A0AA35Z0K0_LACSI|nr:unnamed protein product [Lactuca saligna]
MVKKVEILEGDGGLGSILLFKFSPHVPKLNFQKEKIVEYDESLHQIALRYWKEGIWIMGLQDIQMFWWSVAVAVVVATTTVVVVVAAVVVVVGGNGGSGGGGGGGSSGGGGGGQ